MILITVVETPEFQRRARAIMTDDERNPMAGVAIGGGVRKFRFAREGRGKSGGYRVIHFYNEDDPVPIFLITVFARNDKASLTRSGTEAVKSLGKMLADSYRSQR